MSYTRRHLLQGSLAGGAAGVLTGLVQGQESSGAKTIRKKPRGVIFCVSDGMSQGVLSMTEAFSNQLRGKGTSWWELLAGGEAVLGLMDTASSSSMVTDSAAASSAWSSGKRVPNGQINFDENGKNLRRAFLRAPVQFSNISSRYNLKRRIALYGNRVKAHKGTDFAAPVGTEILATADGRVIESRRKGGNGNYVKIRHNSTYSTQYLHMKKRLVKVGQYVKQGDVIGLVGMTGNTSGPHVCYRFWKNGKQVDPFKQKLPIAKSVPKSNKKDYQEFILPIKVDLDNIEYKSLIN